ncbi:ABC transporter ATP-binding protein [Gracilibacillus sp. S3-1-1]|uniref:ABC transporter ATP-binding protein n=1 Tax=Gracilibacillus pellucidus TaxID=3095368 RepID=A0ACC6M6K9_9BACI|nr:ABC transporter ATP-binding protein [Gracilibacillus sp. S3-1-1]MDX8046503.1 ABC transporter ATP-binding protein [Gracilibacillus sp. S3-1-1]
MSSILSVEHVSKAYGNVLALDNVSFSLNEGEVVSILGPSGCGKSTLLQAIAGLLKPTDGQIIIDNQKVSDRHTMLSPDKRPVNMVFQDYALWPHMNVYENIAYGLKRRKNYTKKRKEKVEYLLNKLQLNGLAQRMVSHLSGGQQQRVGIARALATEPKILLMDEPLSNLDIKLRLQMRNELAILLKELHTTVVHVTHDPMEAFALADKLLVIRAGKLEQYGPKENVFNMPETEWVAQLLGYTNRLAIEKQQLEIDGDHRGSIQWKGQIIQGKYTSSEKEDAGQWKVIVHPDDVKLVNPNDTSVDREGVNSIRARVKHIVFQGLSWQVILDTEDNEDFSFVVDQPLHVRDEVSICFPVNRTFIFKEENIG